MYESEDENFISSINYHISVVVIFSYGIVSSIGIVGNCINLWLCLNPRFTRDAMGCFNILMSVFNIFSLIAGQINSLPQFIGYQDLSLISDYSCKLLQYLPRVCYQTSAWLNVMSTLERITYFSRQKLFKFFIKKKAPVLTCLGLVAILLVLNSPVISKVWEKSMIHI